MKFLNFFKQYKKDIIHTILVVIVESILCTVTFSGWEMLNNSNIIISIVGSIVFLIGLALLVITVLALILDIHTTLCDK